MNYQVLQGEGLNVAFSFLGPEGNILKHEISYFGHKAEIGGNIDLPKGNGKVSFPKLAPGEYKFCFDNRLVTHAKKQISFDIPEIVSDHIKDKDSVLTSDDTEKLLDTVKELERSLVKVESMQYYLKGRLHRHLWS